MLNLYEPIAETGRDHRNATESYSSSAKQDTAAPSTAEQVLFLVESVYEVGCDFTAQTNAPRAMVCMFRGH
jgi:hypothetical protein